MSNYGFAVRWSEEDAAFIAVCPEFPGLSAFGDTAAEALAEIEVALTLAIETHRAEGWPLPEPRTVARHSGQFRLRLPRSLHAELAARADEEGVSLNALAAAYIARGLGGDAAPRVPRTAASPRPKPKRSASPKPS